MTAPRTPGSQPTASLRIQDVGALRALANPLRMRILGRLRQEGPATVGALASATGSAAGSVSFHVRTLVEHGLVVEVPELARDRRERWWAATSRTTSWEPGDFQQTEDGRDATGELERAVLRSQLASAEAALDHRSQTDPEWVAAGAYGDDRLLLTLDEARELRTDLEGVMARWRARADAGRAAPGAGGADEAVGGKSADSDTDDGKGSDSGAAQQVAPVVVVVHSYRAAP